MILVDANILVFAHMDGSPHHARALAWLGDRMNGIERVGLPWAALLAFVRIVSQPRLWPRAKSVTGAWTEVERWLDAPPVWIPQPGDRHREILATLLSRASHPDLVSDAHLAAIAIEHGLTLMSTDGDFARFPGLRYQNPLLPA